MPSVVPSEELRAAYLRTVRAWQARDRAAVAEQISSEPYLVGVGSDDQEWWQGADAVAAELAYIDEIPAAHIEVDPNDVVAYAYGDLGWVVGRMHVRFESGQEFVLRQTQIYVIERGHWRVAHWHNSIGVPNEDALGVTLTTSIQRTEQAVREARPDVETAAAPDGTVTLMFSDIESSTVLLERLGDTEFLRLLGWHDAILRESAAEHRGFVVKSQGDGFMIAFPSAALALRCGLVIQQRLEQSYDGIHVRVRIGLHAGEALRQSDDFYGRTVVIAARIANLALGGEMLVSELVHELARGLGTFRFGEPRVAHLKGLDGEFRVYPVEGSSEVVESSSK
ncbi:MAG TPA: adenylate/guanylate cyclase domain-containing protein [Acidimicrobiia bacterium]|nr:adenylate/guanylate cyclase domain-containing protein [Acidimicrobiia bacterium]